MGRDNGEGYRSRSGVTLCGDVPTIIDTREQLTCKRQSDYTETSDSPGQAGHGLGGRGGGVMVRL